MNQERLLQVLIEPRVSEKATRLADSARQFVFRVIPNATKPEIRQAVELMFRVEVESVRVCTIKGKVKANRRMRGRRSDIKKAYVSLKPGFDINFVGKE
ncbi:MAG: 50S ribosomal protein L23 [Chromatiales bacterium]